MQGKRLLAIFEPHRYSRTRDCMEEFALAFSDADICIITDVFSAGEAPILGITGEALCKSIETKSYFFNRKQLLDSLQKILQAGDVVVTMGAGDITHFGPQIIKNL